MISHKKLKKLSLGAISADHHGARLFQWRNNLNLFKWFRQNDLLTWENHCAWMRSHQTDQSVKMYMVNYDGMHIGVCGLTSIDLINQRAEFSLYIEPDHHGKGHGANALKLLLWHSFNAYPYHTIWGEVFDGNPALKVFESVGFKKDGLRRDFYFRDGKFIDAHIISIKREEFKL
jgi:RimJ/RimL family protein N-acetyltransferase